MHLTQLVERSFIQKGKAMLMQWKATGDYLQAETLLNKIRRGRLLANLDKFGKQGVEALRAATPVDSGTTASSWYYKITQKSNGVTISFCNSNVNKGVPIAVILQYGHGTRNGGWVEGRDYINPALRPVFDRLLSDAWKEVTK